MALVIATTPASLSITAIAYCGMKNGRDGKDADENPIGNPNQPRHGAVGMRQRTDSHSEFFENGSIINILVIANGRMV